MPRHPDSHPGAAQEFRRLHAGPDLLILCNTWGADSAHVSVSVGAKAVATSSAAIAWSHGYRDGDALPVDLLLATLRDIARVVTVPITADIEGGYSEHPEAVGETISALIDAGVVGINVEDGSRPPDLLCAKIHAARQTADRNRVALFINARTDVFLEKPTRGVDMIAEAIARAPRYAEAGADGVFVPGISDAGAIGTLAQAIPLPLNVVARPGLPCARQSQRLGVRR